MPPSAASSQTPWHAHLTIDLFAHVINRSLLHPFIAWLIPLSLRAVHKPYDAPDVIVACVWATFVTLLAVFGVVNKRVAYGVPREVDWAEEVVVITGGASGLGRVLVQMYAMRGASVAALDVRLPSEEVEKKWDVEEVEGARFYRCDISDTRAVELVRDRIENDVCSTTSTTIKKHLPPVSAVKFHAVLKIQRKLTVSLLFLLSTTARAPNNPHQQRGNPHRPTSPLLNPNRPPTQHLHQPARPNVHPPCLPPKHALSIRRGQNPRRDNRDSRLCPGETGSEEPERLLCCESRADRPAPLAVRGIDGAEGESRSGACALGACYAGAVGDGHVRWCGYS